jgi:lipid-binding SYLF domain-containing protein
MAKGLYGGFSVDGSVAGVRATLNKAYYGKETTPTDILIKGDPKNPHAAPLLQRVTEVGK